MAARPHRTARIALLAGLVAVGWTAFAQPTVESSRRFEVAHEAYAIGHYGVAFAEFAALADAGHCEAARIAQQMLRYGRVLYGVEFHLAPQRTQRWTEGCPARLVARPG